MPFVACRVERLQQLALALPAHPGSLSRVDRRLGGTLGGACPFDFIDHVVLSETSPNADSAVIRLASAALPPLEPVTVGLAIGVTP